MGELSRTERLPLSASLISAALRGGGWRSSGSSQLMIDVRETRLHSWGEVNVGRFAIVFGQRDAWPVKPSE